MSQSDFPPPCHPSDGKKLVEQGVPSRAWNHSISWEPLGWGKGALGSWSGAQLPATAGVVIIGCSFPIYQPNEWTALPGHRARRKQDLRLSDVLLISSSQGLCVWEPQAGMSTLPQTTFPLPIVYVFPSHHLGHHDSP